MTLDLSCPDWEQRLLEGRSLVPERLLAQLPNPELGARAVAAFDRLRLADVTGTPTLADAGGDWFRDIVRAMFAALDPASQVRVMSELFGLVPKKNAKTTYGALGLMLVGILLNERPRARFALVAPVQDTADEAFKAAGGAIELDPVLGKLFHVRNHIKTIVHRTTKAELEIMTFDPEVLTGKKFAYVLIDELHVIAKSAKASSALRQIRGGMVPFPEGFLAFITTMPEDEPVGEMKAELAIARAVRDGKSSARRLSVLYEFPRAMQQDESKPWLNPELWPLVNPNLGRSVTIPKLMELYELALEKGEADVRGWASQHLNVEVGLALKSNSWPGAEFWPKCGPNLGEDITLADIIERCDVATVGIDGGGLDDLLGLVVLGREREATLLPDKDGTLVPVFQWLAWARAWAHPIVLQRRKEIAQQLQDLKAAGDLVFVDRVGQDVDELADIVEEVHKAGLLERDEDEKQQKLASIGVDPAGIGGVVEELLARGVPEEAIIGIPQGWQMNGAVKTCERRVAGGTLRHGGQRLMTWCVGNARVEPRGNAIIVTKQASGSAKIDPLLALFDAVSLMMRVPEGAGEVAIQTITL